MIVFFSCYFSDDFYLYVRSYLPKKQRVVLVVAVHPPKKDLFLPFLFKILDFNFDIDNRDLRFRREISSERAVVVKKAMG